MANTLTIWHLVLYLYFGIRFTLHVAHNYYMKQNHDYEKDDIVGWLAILVFRPLFLALYAVLSVRGTAILLALYYGLLPWQLYEKEKHYKGSYLKHALMNIGYALKWAFFLESKADREFEKTVNNNY